MITLVNNNLAIDTAFSYLYELISWRIKNSTEHLSQAPQFDVESINNSLLGSFLLSNSFSTEEIITILIAFAPQLNPTLLLTVVTEEFPGGTEFPEFGGVKGKNHRGIIPTGETVQFILAGMNTAKRIEVASLFDEEHIFSKKGILFLENPPQGEPFMSGKVLLTEETFYALSTGVIPQPKLSPQFPAERIETNLNWDDLILNPNTLEQIKDLETWLQYNDILLDDWKMKSKIKPGYIALFYGPSGTGKTLTASLLGKYTNKQVYRVDLSTLVSKYIGETEKNLANLFNKAANKEWVLFCDEADSIFGKRTNVKDAHDKYANQEVSYLLQRIESHEGLVILASNFKDNIDDAFTRRFQAMVPFELPGVSERKLLWEKNFPEKLTLADDIDLLDIARKFELSGSNIMNIIHYCSLLVLQNNSTTLSLSDLLKGIKKEYRKEDRII